MVSSSLLICFFYLTRDQVIVYIIIGFFAVNTQFAVLESQENPILSDSFGLNIQYTSYILAGTLVLYGVANLTV